MNGQAGGYDKAHVRRMLRALIDCPKLFAERHGWGASTVHQQMNGYREPSARLVHCAQADAHDGAGDWRIYDYLNALRGSSDEAPTDEPATALLLGLTSIEAELGDVARLFVAAIAPDSPGGAAITWDELAGLEPAAAEVVTAATFLLSSIRGLRAPRHDKRKGAA